VLTGLTRVEARGLTRLYGSVPALRGVSAEFRAGEITILSGPNGAGKSTLLAILGTRLRPTGGTVAYWSNDRTIDRIDVRAHLGWVSHEPNAYAELTGRENIELALALHGQPAERFQAVAEELELGAFAERPVGTLSRGQRQRVSLARALGHSPSLLLLDEPWTGLDVHSAQLLERICLSHAAKGAIVIVVSHEPGLTERLGAREVRIEAGRLSSSRLSSSR
jgi:ABC-2 type transport system ATP-binding protein